MIKNLFFTAVNAGSLVRALPTSEKKNPFNLISSSLLVAQLTHFICITLLIIYNPLKCKELHCIVHSEFLCNYTVVAAASLVWHIFFDLHMSPSWSHHCSSRLPLPLLYMDINTKLVLLYLSHIHSNTPKGWHTQATFFFFFEMRKRCFLFNIDFLFFNYVTSVNQNFLKVRVEAEIFVF